MKTLLALLILSCVIALPVSAELTDADLDKIRLIVKEEVKPLQADIGTLKTDVANIKGRLTGIQERMISIENSIDRQNNIIIACIAIPMAIIAVMVAWRSLTNTSLQKQIDTLSEKLETQ